MYFEDRALYTHVDPQGQNCLEYINAMARSLRHADMVLLLGTASGALVTKLSGDGKRVTAVDDCPISFEIARAWFQLPAEVECIIIDAIEFLRSTDRLWEGIAIDVFHGVENPDSMFTREIASLLIRRVAFGGVMVWNVADVANSWQVRWITNA